MERPGFGRGVPAFRRGRRGCTAGLTAGVTAAIDRALRDHELVKVRIAADRAKRSEFAARIAAETSSEIAGIVGRVAIFYRAAPDPADRKIRLPSTQG
jgi:RNA-binding protein YhbY